MSVCMMTTCRASAISVIHHATDTIVVRECFTHHGLRQFIKRCWMRGDALYALPVPESASMALMAASVSVALAT